MEQELQLLIVAGDPLARAALASLFDNIPGCHVTEQINPSTLVTILTDGLDDLEFDVVIWDLGWESADVATIDFQDLERPVLVLFSNGTQAEEAWAAGARALIKRHEDGNILAAAVVAAAHGLLVLDSELATHLFPFSPHQTTDLLDIPTPRELEVLQLLAEGLTNKVIAQQLNISPHTVKFHVNAILGKLNVQSRTEAVVRATRLGLISL